MDLLRQKRTWRYGCHSLSESIVEMNNKAALIAASGYTLGSNERTWRERMKKLDELGFIKIAPGKHGDISCVLLLNPHTVLRRHKEKGTPGFDERIFNCIKEEIAEFGMKDFHPRNENALTSQAPPEILEMLNKR